MDLFDAFMLHNEQVLFHTTFTRLEQAKETPYLSPDLETMARMADDVRAQTPAPDRSSTEHEHPEDKAPATVRATAYAEKSVHRADHPEDSGIGPATKTTRPPVAIPMSRSAENDRLIAISRPFRKKPVQKRAVSSMPHRRTRRYALTLTVVLILLLIVALSSVLLLQQRRSASRVETDIETAPLPSITPHPKDLDSPQTGLKPQAPVPDQPAPPIKAAPSAIADRPENTAPVEVIENDAPSRQATVVTDPAPPVPAPVSEASREIMRVETEKFTLMVERPAAKTTAPSPPFSHQTPLAIDEIVHQVVPGDTLWDIAAHYLDDPFQYPELARLSQISNPDLIYPGDIIHIIRKER
jgi:LysM repeat protein